MITFPYTALDEVSAGSNQTSAGVDVSLWPYVSCLVKWTSLTGTINGTVALQTSVDGISWDPKTDANGDPVVVTLSGASGHSTISLNGVVSESALRFVYTKNGVTGGTITCKVHAKGGKR